MRPTRDFPSTAPAASPQAAPSGRSLALSLSFIFLLLPALAGVAAGSSARLWFEPAVARSDADGVVTLEVRMSTDEPSGIGAAGVELRFDPAQLNITAIEDGVVDRDPVFLRANSTRLSYSGQLESGAVCGHQPEQPCPGADGAPFLLVRLAARLLPGAEAACLRPDVEVVGDGRPGGADPIHTTAERGAAARPGVAPPACGAPVVWTGRVDAEPGFEPGTLGPVNTSDLPVDAGDAPLSPRPTPDVPLPCLAGVAAVIAVVRRRFR